MDNKDRHLCKTCKYKATSSIRKEGARCEYINKAKKMRGCPVESCDKYERKKRKKYRKTPLHLGKI